LKAWGRIKKGGLSKTLIRQVERGQYEPLEASELTKKDMRRKRPDLFREYDAVQRLMQPQKVE
jgi:hypothetical protein